MFRSVRRTLGVGTILSYLFLGCDAQGPIFPDTDLVFDSKTELRYRLSSEELLSVADDSSIYEISLVRPPFADITQALQVMIRLECFLLIQMVNKSYFRLFGNK